MTAMALNSSPNHLPVLNWGRISAYSGSFGLHIVIAMLLLIPPAAMEMRRIVQETHTEAIFVEPPPITKPEPPMPLPPVKIKHVAPPAPPKPEITITAPIDRALPAPAASPLNSIAAPVQDAPAATAPLDDGAGKDVAPSALAYAERTHIPYPSIALRNHEEGTVTLRVLVGMDGSVQQIEIDKSSGSRNLDNAARSAVMKWKFKPGMRNGAAYAAWAIVPINFSLPR